MIIGGVVGVVFSSYDVCHEWGGYWMISFVICLAFEIFFLEVIYMLIRWASLSSKAKSK